MDQCLKKYNLKICYTTVQEKKKYTKRYWRKFAVNFSFLFKIIIYSVGFVIHKEKKFKT